MAKKITFKVKDPERLRDYFSKYSQLDPSIFLILHEDRMEIRGFSSDKDLTKMATISYSDVFEEAQVDIDQEVHVGLINKIKRLIMCLNMYQEEFSMTFNIETITDTALVNHLARKGFIDKDSETALTTSNIKFKGSNLTLTVGTALNMIKDNFELNDGYIKSLKTITESNQLIGKFVILGTELKQLKTLSDNDTNKYLTFNLNEDVVSILSESSFKRDFEATSDSTANFQIIKDILKYMDVEDQTISIVDNDEIGIYIIIESNETETLSFCSIMEDGEE